MNVKGRRHKSHNSTARSLSEPKTLCRRFKSGRFKWTDYVTIAPKLVVNPEAAKRQTDVVDAAQTELDASFCGLSGGNSQHQTIAGGDERLT